MIFSLTATTTAAIKDLTAGEVGVVALVGVLIVFSVLAIIYFALITMQSIFTKGSKPALYTVTAPFSLSVEYLVAQNNSVNANDVVMVVSNTAGAKNEILAPGAGKLKISVEKGSSAKQGDTLFTIG